ncbi:hypothetical protein D3C78_1321340 [compost metagenome]
MLTLTGKLTEANTLFTDWISEKIVFSASSISVALVAVKYLPPPARAILCSSLVASVSCLAL